VARCWIPPPAENDSAVMSTEKKEIGSGKEAAGRSRPAFFGGVDADPTQGRRTVSDTDFGRGCIQRGAPVMFAEGKNLCGRAIRHGPIPWLAEQAILFEMVAGRLRPIDGRSLILTLLEP